MEKKDLWLLILFMGIFSLFYVVPYQSAWFNDSIISGVNLLNDYAKQHVLTCLVPALFIAGAIAVLVKKDNVLKYMGPKSNRVASYAIASVSGTILAVCSCTILPLFAGIRKRGAGLGPATTFLFSGPAINIAAIFLTMSVLGFEIGIARIVSAVLLSILVGITMSLIFKEEIEKGTFLGAPSSEGNVSGKVLALFFIMMIGILIVNGLQMELAAKYLLMGLLAAGVAFVAIFKFPKETLNQWLDETWAFSKQILPLLFIGVFFAGFIMPLLPEALIYDLVGQNTIQGNLVASVFGSVMYFSTLTEIPILQALIAKGMAEGPALALLLAGPSLSLPSMMVIKGILGLKKAAAYVALVIIYATLAGFLFGMIA